jgi:hypothetical protein
MRRAPFRSLAALLLVGLATPAAAEAQRDLCTDRPGLGSPACTVEPGHVVVEIGLGDFTHQRDARQTVDEQVGLDTLVRLGVGAHDEVQVGWSPFGHVRTRDAATGEVANQTRVGDVTLAVQRNLANPDGSGASIAVRPFVTVPVGRQPVGLGDWGAGVIVPMTFDLSRTLHLGLTPEIDAAVDEDGRGRHLAYGSVVGLALDVSDAVSLTVEAQALRDRDPDNHATQTRASLSAAWQPGRDWQLDAGVVRGLNHDTPDIEGYVGVSRRF